MAARNLMIARIVFFTWVVLSVPWSQASGQVTGTVFNDRNGNGQRDAGEPGTARVVVSNQVDAVTTDSSGTFHLRGSGTGVVFVSIPNGQRATTRFWQPANAASIAFGLTPSPVQDAFSFIHASDTHIQPSSVPRVDRLRAIIDSVGPAFVLVTGDLTRDALRVPEAEARGYYELYLKETARITMPVWSVPGNHELFGIERHLSLVSTKHPLYGRGMYRHYLGPDYYSFNAGGVHFVGLNTADNDDLWYYGHVDSTQLRWLANDLSHVPSDVPVVTFNHIPFASGMPSLAGVEYEPPAPTIFRVKGKDVFRHVVSNLEEVLAVVGTRPFPLALGGHNHARERLEFATQGRAPIRFEQTGAVVGPAGMPWYPMASGVTVYTVRGGRVSEGTFVRLDPVTPSRPE
jgi:3',5'-cyclic AMP phosphodiesterase CpdA